ncbi:MAG: serine/threonine protein kinase [Deltaproteobacteria bacterium]|nr:serine/threonine protein kinase [Deltaproteobacteria bacterium]
MLGETLGNYRVLSKLGEGGMGVVYIAEHVSLGKRAAIKVLLPELSQNREVVTRFFNEARATTLIKHAGIVAVFDFGHHTGSGAAYIAMELLEGESLSARLRRAGTLAAGSLIPIARQATSALAAAHAAGIVHRDLKPDNLFLEPDPDHPSGVRLKVLDFGIAKLASEAGPGIKTRTQSVMGTPIYMSPEQCKGAGTVDARADIYSLGCVLFELATGRPPFQAEGAGELITMHLRDAPPALGTLAPALPARLAALIMRMLEKAPEARPQRMDEVKAELDAIATSPGLTAPPPVAGPTAPTIAAVGPTATPAPPGARPTTLGHSAGQLATAPAAGAGRGRGGMIALALVALAGVAAALVLWQRGKSKAARGGGGSGGGSGSVSAGGRDAGLAVAPTPAAGADAGAAPDSPAEREFRQALADAEQALAEERWAGAMASADVALKLRPDDPAALAIRERALRAEASAVFFADLGKAIARKDFAHMLELQGRLAGSALQGRADAMVAEAREAFLKAPLASAQRAAARGSCKDITRKADEVRKVVADWAAPLDELAAKCAAAPRSPRPTPSPSPTLPPSPSPGPTPGPGPDQLLSKAQILAGVAPLRAAAHACAVKLGVEGVAVVQLTIKPNGTVGRALVTGNLAGTPAAECLVLAARELKFDTFRAPEFRFNYPVPVR